MQLAVYFLIIFAVLAVGNAHTDSHSLASRHTRLIRRRPTTFSTNVNIKKRCKTRPTTNKAAPPPPAFSAKPKPASDNPPEPKPSPTASSSNKNTGGTIHVQSDCGPSGATDKPSKTTGPNGSIDWLNCGIKTGGWNPPHVTVSDLIFVPLSEALAFSNSPYKACTKYRGYFEKYASQHNIPSIILAAIAMQESSCNENEVGGGGEQGLMQITKDKCGDAPGDNCRDPDYNVRVAANFFAATLKDNGGNLLLTFGRYNGWYQKLTVAKATAARSSNCCLCQNNLDYIHQVTNGWLQGIDPRAARMGEYFNLEDCP